MSGLGGDITCLKWYTLRNRITVFTMERELSELIMYLIVGFGGDITGSKWYTLHNRITVDMTGREFSVGLIPHAQSGSFFLVEYVTMVSL
jgi:hypothetical protein